MKFNYKLVKAMRESLGIGRHRFCEKVNTLLKDRNVSEQRLFRLESGKKTTIHPDELGAIFKSLNKDANYFYD